MQISFAVTEKLISTFVLATQHNPSTFLIRNFKPLALFSNYAARFVSDLVGYPEDRFSCIGAHISQLWTKLIQQDNLLGPSFFYFLFYRFFLQQVSVGGRNKNKNKIHSDHFPIELKSKETQLCFLRF